MRVLVVENQARLAEFVRQGLEQAGHVADAAKNDATGLEMTAILAYNVILLDSMLPGQNGFGGCATCASLGCIGPLSP